MKSYVKFFKGPFIFVAVLLVIGIVCKIIAAKNAVVYTRTNTECTTTERVFDYADKLTDKEENELREKIAKAEQNTGCDIIIVTLNESLKEYAKSYEDQLGHLEPYEYVMVYADNFYDENKFGFDKPVGDGVILVDNWYREADGKVYSWMGTSGKVYEAYSEEMIDETLDISLDAVEADPAWAYGVFVEYIELEMGPTTALFTVGLTTVISLVVAFFFFLINCGGKIGRKTIDTFTYVSNGKPNLRLKEDQFLTKTIKKRKIERDNDTDSSSGRGGSHVSAGGHTHGGGGHSR